MAFLCGILLKNPKSEVAMQENKTGDSNSAKKLYVKPEVRFERVFETMALSCGKISETQAQCHSNRKNS